MSGRVRVPSSRALASLDMSGSSTASTSTASIATKRKGKGRVKAKKSKIVEEEDDEQPEENDTMSLTSSNHPTDDNTLYCICLGRDDRGPMIQCGRCANWFHFSCISLTEERAAQIESYKCDLCQELGYGPTKLKSIEEQRQYEEDDSPSSDSDEDNEQEDDDSEDEAYGSDLNPIASGSGQGRKRKSRGGSSSKKKGKKTIDRKKEDEEDEEYTDDEDVARKDKSRSKRIIKPTAKASQRRQSTETETKSRARKASATVISKPIKEEPKVYKAEEDKTRKHCIAQLTGIFKSIFSVADATGTTDDVDTQAIGFAEAVEGELFDGFGEVDSNGIKSTRQKYLAKFRSLHFNLKSNAAFRSSISANDLLPIEIVNMTQEDLLTPELRKMAENIRAASLKHSVKEVVTAPTAKRTHKGEEAIDTFAGGVESEVRIAGEREKEEKAKNEAQGSPQSPSSTQRPSLELRRSSNLLAFSTSASASGETDSRSPIIESPSEFGRTSASPRLSNSTPHRLSLSTSSSTPTIAPPAIRNRTGFDLNSILGSVKPKVIVPVVKIVDKDEDAMDMSDDESNAIIVVDEKEEEYDPFGKTSASVEIDDEDFEAMILGHSAKSKPLPPPVPVPSTTTTTSFNELPPVWAGDVLVPEEGGFPAFGVQIGGRPFPTTRDTWSQLLPLALTMDGRIPTKTANKYLVECSFAQGRELVVLGLLPDLTGPSEFLKDKPTAARCAVKYAHIIDFYVKKDRIGVISPPPSMKKLVKDIYLIPLKKDAALPEYIELLDEHLIPDSNSRSNGKGKEGRTEDLLLLVLVVQKGAIASSSARLTLAPADDLSSILSALSPLPPPPPASLPSTTLPPPSLPAPAVPEYDLASLTSLLANPSLLATLASLNTIPSPSLTPAVLSPPQPSTSGGRMSIHPDRMRAVIGDDPSSSSSYGSGAYSNQSGSQDQYGRGGRDNDGRGGGGGGRGNERDRSPERNNRGGRGGRGWGGGESRGSGRY